MTVNNVTLAIGATLICVLTGLVAALIASGQEVAPLIAFVAGIIPTTVTGLVTLSKLNTVSDKVDQVQNNVNGHLTTLSRAAGLPVPTEQEGTDG